MGLKSGHDRKATRKWKNNKKVEEEAASKKKRPYSNHTANICQLTCAHCYHAYFVGHLIKQLNS